MDFLIRYQKYWLWSIVLISLAASLSYSFYFRIQPIVDARAYDTIAWDIVQGKGYDRDSAIGRPGPGYEFFLAFIYYLFGHSYPAVWIIQALLLGATAYITFFISRLVFGALWHPLIGLAAAAFIGLSPDLITVSAMLMTETFFLFFATSAIYLFFKYVDRGRAVWLAPAAVVLAGAVLTRSNFLFLVFPIAIWFIWKKDWWRGLLFFFVFLLAMTPWTVRNYKVYGEFMPFNAAFGLLYVGNHPEATGELVINYPIPEGYGDFSKLSQIDNDKALRKAGKDYILQNPIQFIKLTLWRLSIYFSFARPFAFWPHLHGFAKLATIAGSAIYSFLIFGLGLAGAALALAKNSEFANKDRLFLLFGMFVAMPLSIAALIVETRYRFASYPFLAIFAGLSVYYLISKRDVIFQKIRTIGLVLILLVGNTIFDIVRNLSRILERI